MLRTLLIGWATLLGFMLGYTGYLVHRGHTLRDDKRYWARRNRRTVRP